MERPDDTSRNKHLVTHEAIRMGLDLTPWHERMAHLKTRGTRIIAIRGAGSVNGIHPEDALAAATELAQTVSETLEAGQPVAILYDGDDDVPERPDVGAIFGRIADMFDGHPHFTALAAQTEGWYGGGGKPIASAGGTAYETYVFANELEGAHSSVTQSESLVLYDGYEQYFVGPVGPIAAEQLKDVSRKSAKRPAGSGPVQVRILRTRNNPDLDAVLHAKLQEAPDDTAREKNPEAGCPAGRATLRRIFNPDGTFALDTSEYAAVWFEVSRV